MMVNVLLEDVEYKQEETSWGLWWHYMYENGHSYHEFKSYATVLGMPLLHYTAGKNPVTGKRVMAKGFIAVGRKAFGVIALGQLAIGIIAVACASGATSW